ncbi:tRNA lysidine(34) synthetase TilS [Cognatishimia sp. WU-CL00825]|uniref:tRNA lysidine(34) synthetase TilS n=1 Tax=Cognatishimia sp. WU-CL00825 TaxID=3127658 RepID=UPI0031039CF6
MLLGKDEVKIFSAVSTALALHKGEKIGVAVSGGGDSVGLLHLLHQICRNSGKTIEAITVDHGLRDGSAAEAEFVKTMCNSIGVRHASVLWAGWKGDGNLQNEARRARYRLIADWAISRQLSFVCLGHTENDVAETFLMRVARESGVDGLSRMSADFQKSGMHFLRPLLDVSRSELRSFLRHQNIDWCEDPSNRNEAFERVRARRALKALDNSGISISALAAVSRNMSQARDALRAVTHCVSSSLVAQRHGDLIVQRAGFLAENPEIQRRLLNDILSWISNRAYPVRRAPIADLMVSIQEQRNFSLGGCMVFVGSKEIRIAREYNAVRDLVEYSPMWDRWAIEGPWRVGMAVRALGEPSLAILEDWRALQIPRQTLMASPSVWQKDKLLAAPLAQFGQGWQANLINGSFHDANSPE